MLYFLVLRLFFKPEFKKIEGAEEFFKQEKANLGRLTNEERNTFIAFGVMLILWVIPVFTKQFHFLNIWIVPPIGVILLYILPVKEKQGTLTAKDLKDGIPWNVVFLAVAGTTMAGFTVKMGVITWITEYIPSHLSGTMFAFFGAYATSIASHFISGTATVALMSNLLFPIAQKVGLNPATLAWILPASGMAISLPWAGAASATAFSSGQIRFMDMIKAGATATVIHVFLVVLLSLLLVPLFGAFTIMS